MIFLNLNDEKLLNEFVQTRNLTRRTEHGYRDSLKKYTNFHSKSFCKLINEADYEEEIGVRWKNRMLKQRLIKFRAYLYSNFMSSSAKTHFQRILTLYKHFEIEIHDLPKISTKSTTSYIITFEDLPSKKIIKDSLEIANPVMRALILFILSSGCARREALNLTINDFIEATYEYHHSNGLKSALFKLNKLNDIVPIFKIKRQKTNKFYFTFCSPEATNEIISYLLKNRKIIGNDPLFKINLNYLNQNFAEINEKLNLPKVGKYRKLRTHMLRKLHASLLYNFGNDLSLNEIDSLQGRSKDSVHSAYFMENPNILKKKYIKSLDVLKIF